MCTLIASDCFNEFHSYSVFTILSVLDLCPENINILTPKIRALQMGLRIQNSHFLDNGSNEYDYISKTYGESPPDAAEIISSYALYMRRDLECLGTDFL
jgi:hypothetical protein